LKKIGQAARPISTG